MKRRKIKYQFTSVYVLVILVLNLSSCKNDQQSFKEGPLYSLNAFNHNPLPKKDKLDAAIYESMDKNKVPGLNIAFIKNGNLKASKSYGVLQKGKIGLINEETMFSVGSISKVVNAIIILKLVNEGKLNLDENVNKYLTQWKVEENEYTKDSPVTLRKILSHTAGFTVHGFADYLPDEPIPNTLEILNGVKPAKNKKVYVDFAVGSKHKYSGGGVTVTQMIIEEMTGLPYHKAAEQILVAPLKLKRTSFENPLPVTLLNIAKAHDKEGNPVALPRGYQSMPEVAASGLWISPSDLSKILSAVIKAHNSEDSDFIKSFIIEDMITPQSNSRYGLGPRIDYFNKETIVHHGGANDSYKAHFKVFWKNQTGYVIFTNGANGKNIINELMPLLDEYVNSF